MSVRSFPFAGQDSAEDDYYRLHRESGVISGLDLTLSGLTWSLSVGEMFAGGSMMLVETSPATGASVATSGANPRRDMLVARRTLLPDGSSNTVPALLQGATAGSPSDPTPTQNVVGVFEEPLWSWQVPGSGGTTLTSIRDLRRPAPSSAHVSGAIAGSVPPPGTPLIEKIMYLPAATSGAGGDNTYFYPGGPFRNGVVSIHTQAVRDLPYTWNPWNVQLDKVNVRLFSGTSAVLNTTCPLALTVKGW